MVDVEKTWELLKGDSLLPALHFIKVYPKQSPGCSAVGASAGALDPKTHRKWVWAFIDAIVSLVDVVASKITSCGQRKLWYFLIMTTCDSFGSADVGKC